MEEDVEVETIQVQVSNKSSGGNHICFQPETVQVSMETIQVFLETIQVSNWKPYMFLGHLGD